MPFFLFIIALLLCSGLAKAEEEYRKVQIAEPYIELHTGPGRGYPVFYVIDRGEWIQIVKRRTDWFKVIAANGKTGWTHQGQLELTLNPEGEQTRFEEVTQGQFINRKFEAGVLGGDLNGAQSITLYGGYAFTRNISAELSFAQAVGNFSSNVVTNINLLHQAFPEWRVSPFLPWALATSRPHPAQHWCKQTTAVTCWPTSVLVPMLTFHAGSPYALNIIAT